MGTPAGVLAALRAGSESGSIDRHRVARVAVELALEDGASRAWLAKDAHRRLSRVR